TSIGVVNFGAVILPRAPPDREHRGRLYAGSPRRVALGVANRVAVSALIPAGNLASACRWAGASARWAAASPAKAAMQPSGSALASARMAPAQARGPARASRLDDPT